MVRNAFEPLVCACVEGGGGGQRERGTLFYTAQVASERLGHQLHGDEDRRDRDCQEHLAQQGHQGGEKRRWHQRHGDATQNEATTEASRSWLTMATQGAKRAPAPVARRR